MNEDETGKSRKMKTRGKKKCFINFKVNANLTSRQETTNIRRKKLNNPFIFLII